MPPARTGRPHRRDGLRCWVTASTSTSRPRPSFCPAGHTVVIRPANSRWRPSGLRPSLWALSPSPSVHLFGQRTQRHLVNHPAGSKNAMDASTPAASFVEPRSGRLAPIISIRLVPGRLARCHSVPCPACHRLVFDHDVTCSRCTWADSRVPLGPGAAATSRCNPGRRTRRLARPSASLGHLRRD